MTIRTKNLSGGIFYSFLLFVMLAGRSVPAGAAPVTIGESLQPQFDITAALKLPEAASRAIIDFHRQENGDTYRAVITPAGISILAVAGGSEKRLAIWPRRKADGCDLILQRRESRLTVIADGLRLGTIYDSALDGGDASLDLSGRATAEEYLYQPIEPVYFTDDFMRPEGETGSWDYSGGVWKQTSIGDPNRSANPFSCSVTSAAGACALTGYDFWSDYTFETSCKASGKGAIGLLAGYRDSKNYLAFRWTAGESGNKEILLVRDGSSEVLASAPGGFKADQWYRLRLRLNGTLVQAFIGNRQVLEADGKAPARGRAALYADGADAWFDDVYISSWQLFQEDFKKLEPGKWSMNGQWRLAGNKSGGLEKTGRGEGTAAAGEKSWSDYTLAATINIKRGAAAGLTYLKLAGEGYRFSVDTASRTAALYRLADGKRTLVAGTNCPFNRSGQYTLQAALKEGHHRLSVNGQTLLEHFDPDNTEGAIGLWANAPVLFSNVSVRFYGQETHEESVTEQFTREATMSEWASEVGAWAKSDIRDLYWLKGNCYGDLSVVIDTTEILKQNGRPEVIFCGDGREKSGYGIELTLSKGTGKVPVSITRNGKIVRTGEVLLEENSQLLLRKCGAFIVVAGDEGRLVFKDAEAAAMTGRRLGFRQKGTTIAWPAVQVRPSQIYDYTFHNAPTDWRTAAGKWELTNRWSCSPQWSWFGGESQQVSAIWNEHQLEGDMTAEVYASFRMDLGHSPNYSRTSDINLTLGGDGYNLNSGYSFIYGGFNNTRTCIMRRGRVVAETSNPAFLFPSYADGMPPTNDLHRRWFCLKAERQGKTVRLYIDNKLAVEYIDPKPLPGGRTAVWSSNNGIMVARTIINYEKETPLPSGGASKAVTPAPAATMASALTIGAISHPVWGEDFEGGAPRGFVGGENVELALAGDAGGHWLRAVNLQPGGSFEVRLTGQAYDLQKMPFFTGKYRFEPGVKADLFIRLKDVPELFRLRLTGPAVPIPGVREAGMAAGFADDGKWRRLQVNLLARLRPLLPDQAGLTVQEIFTGNLSHHDYLMCGFGGNGYGLACDLDDIFVYGPAGASVRVIRTSGPGAGGSSLILDRYPDTQAPARTESARMEAVFDGLADGLWYLHARELTPSGKWGTTRHLPLLVDSSAPGVTSSMPAPEGRACMPELQLQLEDISGIEPRSLQLKIADRKFSWLDGSLGFDPQSSRLQVNMSAAGLQFADGQRVEAVLESAADMAGNAIKEPFAWAWNIDYRRSSSLPGLEVSASVPDLAFHDFESDLNGWAADNRQHITISREAQAAASGSFGLRAVWMETGTPGRVFALRRPFKAGRYPLVSFDYRIEPPVRLNLLVGVGGREYNISLNDKNSGSPIGSLPGIIADNKWHRAEVNIYSLLSRTAGLNGDYTVSHLAFADSGFMGNMEGTGYCIDNFRVAPLLGIEDSFAWKVLDVSGGRKVEMKLPGAGDDAAIDAPARGSWALRELKSGSYSISLKPVSGAGRQGPAVERRFQVDAVAPAVARPYPNIGAADAPLNISIGMSSAEGAEVDPASISLKVAGRDYSLAEACLSYDPRSRQLTWDPSQVRPEPVYFSNGQRVEVSLAPLADFSGNRMPATYTWSWTMDFAADRTAPPAPLPASATHPILIYNDFERDLGQWSQPAANRSTTLARRRDAGGGNYGLTIINPHEGGDFRCTVLRQTFDAARYPFINFDYKTAADIKLALAVEYENKWRLISFTAQPQNAIGAIAGVTADNKWHHASLNLLALLQKAFPGNKSYRVTGLDLLGPFADQNKARMSWAVDNFLISAAKGMPVITWKKPYDATGVTGFSYLVDSKPDTLPNRTVNSGEKMEVQATPPAAGLYYFHVRARDAAGNWGATGHYPFVYEQP